MKTLLALIVLGTSFSFSLAYKAGYGADGGYNLIRDSIYISCVSRILVKARQIVVFRRTLNRKGFQSLLFQSFYVCKSVENSKNMIVFMPALHGDWGHVLPRFYARKPCGHFTIAVGYTDNWNIRCITYQTSQIF